MSGDPKIVALGAGSAGFNLVTLGDILKNKNFDKGTLYMVDIDEHKLKMVHSLAKRIKNEFGSKMELVSTSNRYEVLPDADYIILIIGINRDDTWSKDYELGKNFGIYHYAENGGPGSFGHTARNIAVLMPVFNDIQDLAPDSWMINFTNPLPRIHYAINELTSLKCISFCHQFWHGHYILGRLMLPDLQKRIGNDKISNYQDIRNASLKEYDILAAGLNHFSWMLDIKRKGTDEDIYPLIWANLDQVPKKFEALTIRMLKTFKKLLVGGETHISEYLPYTTKKENWDKYNLYPFNFQENKENKIKNMKKIQDMINYKLPLSHLHSDVAERIATIIDSIETNANVYEPALNIENNGCITNLSSDAIVEVPCLLNRFGASGVRIGSLPEPIAAICNQEISIAKLITQGSIKGDIDLITQAFALDPMVRDLELAEILTNAYVEAFKAELPQFK